MAVGKHVKTLSLWYLFTIWRWHAKLNKSNLTWLCEAMEITCIQKWLLVAIVNFNYLKNFSDIHHRFLDSMQFCEDLICYPTLNHKISHELTNRHWLYLISVLLMEQMGSSPIFLKNTATCLAAPPAYLFSSSYSSSLSTYLNDLLLNPTKTKALVTGTRQQVNKIDQSAGIMITGASVPCVKESRVVELQLTANSHSTTILLASYEPVTSISKPCVTFVVYSSKMWPIRLHAQ